MARWFAKRWLWAALTGATVTFGMIAGRADGEGPPKVGSVISLNIDGKGERQFKVLKSDKQPDGTYLSELKDTKSGETITLVDNPGTPPPTPTKPADQPKGKPRPTDPLLPAAGAADPAKDKDKRTGTSRFFGDKDKSPTPPAAAEPSDSGNKRQGLFSRMFGPKKPTGPTMPSTQSGGMPAASAPPIKLSPSTPPPVLPTPPSGSAAAKPLFPTPSGSAATKPLPPFPMTGGAAPITNEPPRVMPGKPVTPTPPLVPAVPTPMIPAFPAPTPMVPAVPTPMPPTVPVPMPSAVPVPMPSAIPVPAPAVPVPTPLPAPPVSIPSGGSGLPPIPVPPGGMSANRPIQVVVPAGYVPAGVAFDREVQPFVIALQTMEAPSARLTAAKALSDCRHSSTDGVKGVLFRAAQFDPCGEVRAACIGHLCTLGYFHPQFLGFIQVACEDVNPMVRDAAKTACGKMIRK
jgi:hypothetical protein